MNLNKKYQWVYPGRVDGKTQCSYALTSGSESDEAELEAAKRWIKTASDDIQRVIVLECNGDFRKFVGEVRRQEEKPEPKLREESQERANQIESSLNKGDFSLGAIKARFDLHGSTCNADVEVEPGFHYWLYRDTRELLDLIEKQQEKPKRKYKFLYPNFTRKFDVKESEPFEAENDHEACERADSQAKELNTFVEVYSFEVDDIVACAYPDDYENSPCCEAELSSFEQQPQVVVNINISLDGYCPDSATIAEAIRAFEAIR